MADIIEPVAEDESAEDENDSEEYEELGHVAAMHTGVGQHTILVEGDVDIATAPRLHSDLQAAFDSEADEVIVDLREVSFIDSTGLGILVNARQRARTTGAQLKLLLPEGQARFPFEVTGLASLFDTAGTPPPSAG